MGNVLKKYAKKDISKSLEKVEEAKIEQSQKKDSNGS